ncbi:hypothetical protein B0H34DRAFT_795856 [Crassisporium funariophilum]|nr:hypothetical protein B0H34DRAFT_795856 [Crassisporium funariophilum]
MQMMAAANAGQSVSCLSSAAKMKAANITPDASTYNAIMSVTARDGNSLFSWAVLDDMLLVGVKPDTTTFTHLVHAQRRRPSAYLWKAWDKMNELGIKPNAQIYTSVINCFVNDGNLEMALQYLFAMTSHNIVPELAAVQAVIILAAERRYSRLAIDLATYFEEVSHRRLEDSAWLACLASAAQNLHMEGVTACWPVAVHQLGIIPNEGICMSVLNNAARHGLPDLATDVLGVLKVAGITWQEYHFAALIEAFCRNNQLKEALVTLHIMRTNKIIPVPGSSTPIVDLIKADVTTLDSAWALIDEIHKADAGVDIDALKVMVKASVSLGDLQRAVGIYKCFSDYNLQPDLATFNLLLDGCIAAQHRQLGDLLLGDMKDLKVKPNHETYEKIILLCLTQEIYEDAFFYLEEMKAATYVPPQSVYEALVQRCRSAGDSRADIALSEMQECGYNVLGTADIPPRGQNRVTSDP